MDPAVDVLPRPRVHADFAAASALAPANEGAAADRVEVALGKREGLAGSAVRPARAERSALGCAARVVRSPARRITATISSTVGGSAG